MNKLKHKKLDLLKLDIEGAEYEVVKSILEDKINAKILCLEFDEYNFNSFKSDRLIRQTAKKLHKNGYILIHREDKNYTFIKI